MGDADMKVHTKAVPCAGKDGWRDESTYEQVRPPICITEKMETVRRPEPRTINIPPFGFVRYVDHMGSDERVIEAARTSTGKGFVSWEPYERCEYCDLIRDPTDVAVRLCALDAPAGHTWKKFPKGDLGILEYLWKNHHSTPFEMSVICTLWKAPILVFRQLHRHRSASYSEASARYMQLPNDFYVPKPDDVKGKSATNKQGSDGTLSKGIVDNFLRATEDEQTKAYESYEAALHEGIAPETARMNLPVSIYSVCMVQMNLRMCLHMLGLRDDTHAQGITQEYARAQAAFVKALFPRVYAAYEEFTKYGVHLSRSEAAEVKRVFSHIAKEDVGPAIRQLLERLR